MIYLELEFNSKEELFERIKPALNAKVYELHRLGYCNVTNEILWNYLIQYKWIQSKNLMLYDIIDDIMHVDKKLLSEYISKINHTSSLKNNDII